jgi:hypothetical protein
VIEERTRAIIAVLRRDFALSLRVSSAIDPNSHRDILRAFDCAVLMALDPEEWERLHREAVVTFAGPPKMTATADPLSGECTGITIDFSEGEPEAAKP